MFNNCLCFSLTKTSTVIYTNYLVAKMVMGLSSKGNAISQKNSPERNKKCSLLLLQPLRPTTDISDPQCEVRLVPRLPRPPFDSLQPRPVVLVAFLNYFHQQWSWRWCRIPHLMAQLDTTHLENKKSLLYYISVGLGYLSLALIV